MCFNKKRKKEYADDDGRTIANMNVDGLPWYQPNKEENDKKKRRMQELKVTRQEKWAMIKGAYLAYLPMLLCILSAFAIVMLLIQLWLS